MTFDDYSEDEGFGVIRNDGDDWITTWTGDGQPIQTHDPALPVLGQSTIGTPPAPVVENLEDDSLPQTSTSSTATGTAKAVDQAEDEGFDTQTVLIGAGLIVAALWLLKK